MINAYLKMLTIMTRTTGRGHGRVLASLTMSPPTSWAMNASLGTFHSVSKCILLCHTVQQGEGKGLQFELT